jgi:hypothetical protein
MSSRRGNKAAAAAAALHEEVYCETFFVAHSQKIFDEDKTHCYITTNTGSCITQLFCWAIKKLYVRF